MVKIVSTKNTALNPQLIPNRHPALEPRQQLCHRPVRDAVRAAPAHGRARGEPDRRLLRGGGQEELGRHRPGRRRQLGRQGGTGGKVRTWEFSILHCTVFIRILQFSRCAVYAATEVINEAVFVNREVRNTQVSRSERKRERERKYRESYYDWPNGCTVHLIAMSSGHS